MADHSSEVTPALSTKALIRGIQGFILFSVVAVALGLWWKKPISLEVLFSQLNWGFVAMLIPLVGLDYLLGGVRYRLFLDGKILPYVSLWNCIRSNWANIFLGAVTPFQTGGGPAQLYILWRCGVKISEGVLISLVNFLATLIFFLISTVVVVLFLPLDLLGNNFTPLLQTGFLVIGGISGLVLGALIFPSVGLSVLRKLVGIIPKRSKKILDFLDRWLKTLDLEIYGFQEVFRQILRKRKGSLALTVLTTLVLFFNKYLMGYVIARALGQKVPFGIFLGLQIVQLFLIYFAPTPGASGLAELSSLWLMGEVMPQNILLIFAVLWRFFTTVLGAFIGGLIIFLDLRFWTQRDLSSSCP